MGTELLSYVEAHELVSSYARQRIRVSRPPEHIDGIVASGRVLANSLIADQDQPSFARATRDGFACRSAEASAHRLLQIAGSTHAGQAPPGQLPPGSVWEIMTGAPVPAGADAVAMIEHVEREGQNLRLAASRSLDAGENVIAQGAQAHAGQELIAAGTRIGPAQIALAATCGYVRLEVFPKPRVAILTTGDELVPVDRTPGPGQIRNSNAPMLAALVSAARGEPQVLPTAADTAEALDATFTQIGDADMLLISGGVSAGKFDLVEPAMARLGAKFYFTGVRIQPGKPLVFGEIPRAAGSPLPFFGLPGNPISSAATFLLFASNVLAALSGCSATAPSFVAAQLAAPTDRKSKPGLTRFLPAVYGPGLQAGGLPQVATVPWHGSADLPAFARANCFVVVPEDVASLDTGAIARVLMI